MNRELGTLKVTISVRELAGKQDFVVRIDDERRDLHGQGEAPHQIVALFHAWLGICKAREDAGFESEFATRPRSSDLLDMMDAIERNKDAARL